MRQPRGPAWLADATLLVPDSTGWRAGVRSAAQMLAPLVVGAAVGSGSGAVVAALVALNVGLVDERGAYWTRFRLLMTTAVLVCGVVGVATAIADQPVVVLVATVAVGVGVALASSLGTRGSRIAALVAIVWTIFAFGDLPDPDVVDRVALTAAGAAWAMLVALWLWPFRATRPTETAVADAWAALSDFGRHPHDHELLRLTRSRVNSAATTMSATRSAPPLLAGQIRALDFLTSAVATIGRREPSGPRSAEWLAALRPIPYDPSAEAMATAVSALDASGAPPSVLGPVRAAERSLLEPAPIAAPTRSTAWRIVDGGRRYMHPGGRQLHYAVRLAVAVAIAGAIALWTGLDMSYWVPLTVFIVLAPTATATVSKGLQRTVGTIVGVAVGIAVVDVVPAGSFWHYLVLAVASVVIGAVMPINYGIGVIFVSTAIIALMAWPDAAAESVAAARLLDTMIGAAIAFVIGLTVWPHHPRDDLENALASALRSTADYVDSATRADADDRATAHLRRTALAAVGDAAALAAEASADWSRPPLHAQRQLVDAIYSAGRSAFDAAAFVRDESEIDHLPEVERRHPVELLTAAADNIDSASDATVGLEASSQSTPAFRELDASCTRAYELATAIAQRAERRR